MNQIQYFMRERIYEDTTGKRTILPPIITPKFSANRNCSVPYFEFYILDNPKNRSTGATKDNTLLEKEGSLTRDKYEVGDFVSTNQFICNTPG